jgi:tRNA-dihydrouridine synthase B
MFDAPNNITSRLSPIRIGSVTLDMPVILAPMAGVTDAPFRQLVQKFGAGLVMSEMIASHAMIRENRKTLQRTRQANESGITAVQLAGTEPEVMAEAARLNVDRGAPIIDINFGCPMKKIVNNFAGSALMRDEKLAASILKAVVNAVKVPVTLKMRLGWDRENMNAPRLAKIAEDCGIKMVTIHGRTRCQFYKGQADWSLIRLIKNAVKIPVIANGDIRDNSDATLALAASGADGVMIGRGTYGRPWFLRQVMDYLRTGIAAPSPSLAEQRAIVADHLDAMLSYYGTYTGLRIARKHIGWYSKGLPKAAEFRAAVNTCDDAEKVRGMIDEFFEQIIQQAIKCHPRESGDPAASDSERMSLCQDSYGPQTRAAGFPPSRE